MAWFKKCTLILEEKKEIHRDLYKNRGCIASAVNKGPDSHIDFLIYAAFFYVHQIDKKIFFSLYFHSHKYNLCYSDGKIYATLMEK